jgi:AcrR family transcriptional regulator
MAGRPAHRPSRRADIIKAATRVFAEKGPRASMIAIARECGLSPTALYYHFAGKDELFSAAVETVAEQIEEATAQAEREATSPLPMYQAVEAVWRWNAEHHNEARLLYSWTTSGPPEARSARERFVDYYRHKVLDRIPGRPRQNSIDDLVDRLAARTYMTLAMGMSEAWVNGEPIGGTHDQGRIIPTLAVVSRRLTGAP